MEKIEKEFVENTIKEICGNFCYSAYDIEKIVDAVIDDVVKDIGKKDGIRVFIKENAVFILAYRFAWA